MSDPVIGLEMTFCPPGNYRYDDDNLIASMKSARDMIAKHIGVDDNQFRMAEPVIAPKEPPHGRVQITLRPLLVSVAFEGGVG